MFYVNNKKVVPLNLFLLSPLSLTHMIQQDGSFRPNRGSINKPRSGGIILCTENFTSFDTIRLANYLQVNLDLQSTNQKGKKKKYFTNIY